MNYEDFENLIISTIDKNAPSNPKTIYPDHVEKTSLNNTYLINKYDSGGMENYANILYNIVADKRLIANDIDMFIGNTLFKYLFSTTGREIYRSLRENKHYIYTSKEDYTDFHIWSVYQISLNTHINNANDALTFITKNINTMFQCYDIEKLYMFKKETSAEAIDNQINRYFVYDYWKHFPLEKREYIYKVLMDCDIDYLKNCLQKFAKHLKLNIVVSNNIDVSTLPDIDYLANLIEGKQNTTNLIKEKTKRKKEPIILDALERFLPAVIPQNQNTTENQVNTKKA